MRNPTQHAFWHLQSDDKRVEVINNGPDLCPAGGTSMLSSSVNWVRSAILIAAVALPAMAQRDPLFKTEILPVLEKNCVACHGPAQKMAKLDLSSFTGMMEGSSSGPVIAPGKPERSLMWKLIENDTMPQGGKLTTAEKQLIKSYIQYGRFPQATAETEATLRAKEAAKITDKDRNWWSFQKPVKPPVPVQNKSVPVE